LPPSLYQAPKACFGLKKIHNFQDIFKADPFVLVIKVLELIVIVLVLRAVFSAVMQRINGRPSSRERPAARRYESATFDKKKMDIEDGEYKELK
jgi:hypothetical protein